ncbi:hypothetical protein D4M24_11760 [Escherichia coli]|nr:hypothetical protein D4M24_11760 [Escherichia coli]
MKAVNDGRENARVVPADGKSITPDDVHPMLEQMVKEAVSRYSLFRVMVVTTIRMFCRRR